MPDTTNASPQPAIGNDNVSSRKKGRWLAIPGLVLFTGPMWGMVATGTGMIRAFKALPQNAAATTDALSRAVGKAMVAAMIGTAAGLVGVVLILTALLSMKNRERWFFHSSVLLAAFWCLAFFPFGLIVGLPVVILFLRKRAEFLDSTWAAGVCGRAG